MQKFMLQLASEKRKLTSGVSDKKPIKKHMSLWVPHLRVQWLCHYGWDADVERGIHGPQIACMGPW